jgi:hypothetical protein
MNMSYLIIEHNILFTLDSFVKCIETESSLFEMALTSPPTQLPHNHSHIVWDPCMWVPSNVRGGCVGVV